MAGVSHNSYLGNKEEGRGGQRKEVHFSRGEGGVDRRAGQIVLSELRRAPPPLPPSFVCK